MVRAQQPGDIKIAGKNANDGMSTHQRHDVKIDAKIRPKAGAPSGQVRLVVRLSRTGQNEWGIQKESDWGGEREASVTFRNLDIDTRYEAKVYAEQRNLDQLSQSTNVTFWTERRPDLPRIDAPRENAVINKGNEVQVRWTHRDADTSPKDPLRRSQVRWRVAATVTEKAGPWTTVTVQGGWNDSETEGRYDIPAGELSSNTFYDVAVRTQDNHSEMWSAWASLSFYVLGTTRPPRLDYPVNSEAVSVGSPIQPDGSGGPIGVRFEWTFRDPQAGNSQSGANLRYRAAGADEDVPTGGWTTVFNGDYETGEPGASQFWEIPAGVFQPNVHYEWQVQTRDSTNVMSDWSKSEFFHTTWTPGYLARNDNIIATLEPQGSLGSGEYRVFIYNQGGTRPVGEIKPLAALTWNRLRDDISGATIRTSGFGEDCCALLGNLRTWFYEMVVFRDGVRVWEGPLTRLSYFDGSVEVEARDPLAYLYRRIMRQGYNDNYMKVKQGIQGPRSVVERASIIISNALAPSDPNVLPWLTTFQFDDDAKEARSIPDFAKTAWEEVDDLAATAGLDYTCVGRRIILWDTHRAIGTLAEMRGEDFFESPVITEYGMNAANIFGVTTNSGLHGEFRFRKKDWYGAGPIEMLAASYGESGAGATPQALTPEQKERKERELDRQAKRNINGRWALAWEPGEDRFIVGAPVVVRIPDNSRVHPTAFVGINQLVPGVHIPLRAATTCREFAQVQKLDSVQVEVVNGEENVRVTMSPAPIGNIDPDEQEQATEE